MSQDNSFFRQILVRKIPQIIGMYIASLWLAVEISDWMSSRFDLPELFSSYVFVGMISMIPAVIVVAWGHGRVGRDEWSLFEKVFIPINLVAALLAITLLVKPQVSVEPIKSQLAKVNPSSQMEMRSIIDTQTGSKMEFEVPKKAFHQKVISYFWENNSGDENLSWLSYGASWMLSQDLKRTPFISVANPYDSSSLLSQIVAKGFKKALDVPLSLALKIARNRSIKWIVLGSFANNDKLIEFTAKLYNVETGEEVKELSSSNNNLLIALDTISDKISKVILSTAKLTNDTNIIPQLAISEHTSNDLSAIEKLIQAKNTVTFDNNYPNAIKFLTQATKIDSSFADAYVHLVQYFGKSGDIKSSIKHAKNALELDYKLYQESVFLVKANLFAYQAEPEKSLKVLENWAKIYPESVEAQWILGSNYVTKGEHQDQAVAVYQNIIELEGPKSKAFINLANIYRLQNNKTLAIEALEQYLQNNPTKSEIYFELADTYKQFGEFDKAKEYYEESSLYDNKDFKAEIGLSKIAFAKGNIKAAQQQLQNVLNESKTDKQKLDVLSNLLELNIAIGQINKSLTLMSEYEIYGKKVLPPITSFFQIDGSKVIQLAEIGQYNKAEKVIAELSKKLKPPYNVLIGAFSKNIYEKQQNIEEYKKALALEEQFYNQFKVAVLKPSILKSQGLLKFWQNDYKGALEAYNQAILVIKQSFVMLFSSHELDNLIVSQSQVLLIMERYDEALESLNNVLKRSPMFAKAHVIKAKVYRAIGNSEKLNQEIAVVDKIWENADDDYIEYRNYKLFKSSL